MEFEPEVIAHVIAGLAMVGSGGVAGLSRKGSAVHRSAGRLFAVSATLTALFILVSARLHPGSVPVLGLIFVVFVSYLILTSVSVIRRPAQSVGIIEIVAPFVATTVAGLCIWFAADAFNSVDGLKDDVPYGYYVFFAAVASLAALFDLNLLSQGGIEGHQRLIRHLWRMLFAFYFATASLFTGPGNVLFAASMRNSILLTVPETIVGLLMLYWIGLTLLREHRLRRSTV